MRAALAALLLVPALAAADAPQLLRVPRPAGGEWAGVYLLGVKAGFTHAALEETEHEGRPAVRATSRFTLRAVVGGRAVERIADEVRIYERRDGGRLLAFTATRSGDGGDRRIEGRCDPERCRVRILADGTTAERTLPHPGERLEDADPLLLVAATRKSHEGAYLDLDELVVRRGRTRFAGEAPTVVGGVRVAAVRVVREDEGQPKVDATIDPATGRTVEVAVGGMRFVGEPEAVAKDLGGGTADLFALTRVALPRPLVEGAREATLVVEGLPPELRLAGPRQRFEELPGGRVRIRLAARAPAGRAERPVPAAGFEAALAVTPAADHEDPAIRRLAAELVAGQPDAFAASRRLAAWVHEHLEKAYGRSSDRASRVLAERRGDCTEHALLLVALARAAGIPARTVHGLVFAELGESPALYWHQWAEVWAGEWIEVDPTSGQAVADATHLALGREGSAEALSVLGRLRVVEASSR